MDGSGKYGYFDLKNREYVITEPKTPTPWINYLGAGEYGGIISNNGGGFSFDRDPRYKRVLRYRYNSIPEDQPGRYIYIRDDETKDYWAATWQPVKADYDFYQCRHGMGYSVISQERKGIATSVTYFVPIQQKMEFWRLKIKNTGDQIRRISLFSYAEFCFFDAAKDQQNVDWVQQIQRGVFEENTIFWNAFMKTWDDIYFSASRPADSFEMIRDKFIGKYRDLSNPIAVENGNCSNTVSYRANGTGSLCHHLELLPGQEEEIIYVLGVTLDSTETKKMLKDTLKPEKVDGLFKELNEYWENYLNAFQIETPSEELDLILNTWNPYQCKTTFNWSRFVSLYQLGIDRGMGFRDSAQDILGVVHTIPEEAKGLIEKLHRCQFEDGHAYHLFYPLTGEGTMGEAEGGKYNWYSDDHLWLIEATIAYLKETGDLNFLNWEIPFAASSQKATVWNHLLKSIDFTAANLGEQGLPLNGFADWNDALNLDRGLGRAESVWTGMLYCRVLGLMIELAEFLKKDNDANRFKELLAKVKTAINTHAWDGEWYLQAFDDEGNKVGSKDSGSEEQIYLNPQSWAIIAGIADEEKARKAIAKSVEYLGTEFGMVLLYPAYKAYRKDRGGISTYPPGAKENAGIFVHTNPWFVMAELLVGLKEDAYRHYQQINPIYKNTISDRHEVEPYVYCQNILGKEHPQFGLGRNSWLTGTASWAYVVGAQYLIGIRSTYDGLIIDPRVPEEWNGFKVQRRFRGKELNITFIKSEEKRIILNGVQLEQTGFVAITDLEHGESHQIEVYY